MSNRGFSHIGVATHDLDKTCEFYAGILGFKPVVADQFNIAEGGQLQHIFFDVGHGQLLAFMQVDGVPQIPRDFDAGINRGLGVPSAFYHFAFEAGSPAVLAEKRAVLQANGIEVTEIIDHGWARSIYFKDPNGLRLEYCCMTRNLTADDAVMQNRGTIPRAVLDIDDTALGELSETRAVPIAAAAGMSGTRRRT